MKELKIPMFLKTILPVLNYLLFSSDSTDVSLLVKDPNHENHHEIGQKTGINLITKNEIDKMYANKVVFTIRKFQVLYATCLK